MDVRYPHPLQSRFHRSLPAPVREGSRRPLEGDHPEMGIKGEETIRDVPVDGGNEFCDLSHFLLVDVAGHQKGARYKERRDRSALCRACRPGKEPQSTSV